jgi:hypothetical protein
MSNSFRQNPTSLSVPDTDAEICLNTWFFVDDTGMVIRIAAKAYALTGSDEEKLTVLKALAGTDHLSATQGRVPNRYITDVDGTEMAGSIPAAAIQADPLPVFDDLFTEIEKSLPQLYRAANYEYQPFKMKLVEPFLWILTSVYESPDGQLIARVS